MWKLKLDILGNDWFTLILNKNPVICPINILVILRVYCI
jgi:hypothetical protein